MSTRRNGGRPRSLGGRPTPRWRRRHGVGVGKDAALGLAHRYYSAINARDLDTWVELLDEDVEIVVDSNVIHGRPGARAYMTAVLRPFPDVVVADRRVVAAARDEVVSEFGFVNPTVNPSSPDEAVAPWRLDGVACEVLRVRGDRVVSVHSYYSPASTDRTPTAEVPSHLEALRIANRQAALGKVATHAAGGGSERELVTVINRVIAELAGVDVSLMMRFETGDTAVVLAASGVVDSSAVLGRRLPLDDNLREVRHGGALLRFAAHGSSLGDLVGAFVSGREIRWCTGVPIKLNGSVWGISVLCAAADEPIPRHVDQGIAAFTQLVTSVLANARANDELRERAREQSELLQVAEIAAAGADPADVFAAVVRSAAAVLNGQPTTLIRFVDDAVADVLAHSGAGIPAAGERIHIDPVSVTAQVQLTGRSARIDEYRQSPGNRLAGEAIGLRASVGVPVAVDGQLWGMLTASSMDEPLPSDIERRLTPFAGTVAIAIAGAQARAELRALADEQAALRRVAELAASDAPVSRLLQSVAVEASALPGVDCGVVVRFVDADGRNEIMAVHGAPDTVARGLRSPVTGHGSIHRVWRTSRAARVDDLDQCDGLWPLPADQQGFTSSAGAPILAHGELWGVLLVLGRQRGFAQAIEDRLKQFAELAGTAISSTDARQKLRALADEQAALRRVAELAAHEAPAEEVLEAVVVEASMLAGVDFTALLRYESDGGTVIVAVEGAPDGVVVGMRAPGTGDGAVQRVWRSHRPARIDSLLEMSGAWPRMAATNGFDVSAAVPVVIRGRLWGVLVVVGRRQSLAPSIEEHLGNFADLAGTAISAAEARQELRVLAGEQAAVRRVAELVARGGALDEIFTAVAQETSVLLGELATVVVRYDKDNGVVAVARSNGSPVEPLSPVTTGSLHDALRRTGRPVRIEHATTAAPEGLSMPLPAGSDVAVPVTVEGRVWGALAVRTSDLPVPIGSEERLTPFAELTAVAIANAENKAKLTASRARVIATADETRRRLQRDVHDGAQQRLVHTIIALKLARDALQSGESPSDLLIEALSNAERASKELRDIVRGILPAALTRGGLRSGLESLVRDLALPVDLRVAAPRLPVDIETTAYFIVAEAMTNVVKHARATRATVDVEVVGRSVVVEVGDDGVGGADAAGGTGLTGLLDRVEAGNGTLTVTSRSGSGTTIRATLPLSEQLSARF